MFKKIDKVSAKILVVVILFPLALLTMGCDPTAGENGTSSLIVSTPEPQGANCAEGGVRVQTGADVNANDLLEPSEVQHTLYLCNGVGLAAVVRVVPEPAGAQCPSGGNLIQYGQDTDQSNALDDEEVVGSLYVCNGQDASNGSSALTAMTPVASGTTACPSGGVRIQTGLDDDGDSSLDAIEVDQSQNICNGLNALIDQSPLLSSLDCLAGGIVTRTGLDNNGNGLLEDNEVTDRQEICFSCGNPEDFSCWRGEYLPGQYSIPISASGLQTRGQFVIEDFVRDGNPDIAITNIIASNQEIVVTARMGIGGPRFSEHTNLPSSGLVVGLNAADLNLDGLIDLIVTNSGSGSTNGAIRIFYGCPITICTSTATNIKFFVPSSFVTASYRVSSSIVVDIDQDGLPDLITAGTLSSSGGGAIQVHRAVSAGSFSLVSQLTLSGFAQGLAIASGDMTGDGILDLVVGTSRGAQVFAGTGQGQFSGAPIAELLTDYISDVHVTDLNRDGRLDIVAQNVSRVSITIWLNSGNGTFGSARHFGSGISGSDLVGKLVVARLNGDSNPDIAVLIDTTDTNIAIFAGNPDGTLREPVIHAIAPSSVGSPTQISAFDFNRDGKPELVTSIQSTTGVGDVRVLFAK